MQSARPCLASLALLLLPLLGGCQGGTAPKMLAQVPEELGERDWHQIVRARLPLYGHRNWIVIADAAYPASSRDGIETIVTGADQVEVVRGVLQALDANKHVRPVVYTDAELKAVPEQDAAGITAYRERLADIFNNRPIGTLPHEQLIAKVDQVSTNFRVLVLKTNMMLPYTTVFIQLDSAYWTADAEKRLRDAQK
jgi:L-fucose mutarotase/ribose pyranase (RbsD/FucU family)